MRTACAGAIGATGAGLTACQQPAYPGEVGGPVPAYAAAAFSGDSIRLQDLHGSVVLLNVWATWCIPCRREIPELQALHQQYAAQGLRVIGVSVDEGGGDADVAGFVKDFGMTYAIARDPADRISRLFRFQGVPASLLIDRKGVVRWRHLGRFTASDSTFQATLQKAL